MKNSAVSLILVSFLVLLVAVASIAAPIAGDVNSDTTVNASDIQLVINAVLGLDVGASGCDINNDDSINASDIQLVINAVLGIDISEHVAPVIVVEENSVQLSGAMFIAEGQVTEDEVSVEADSLIGVVKDEQAYLYHPSLGETGLTETTSRRAIGYWLMDQLQAETEAQKTLDGTVDLDTGIRVTASGSSPYTFENRKRRWAAVSSEAEDKAILLAPRGSIVDFHFMNALPGDDPFYTYRETNSEDVSVNTTPVKTFGSICRHPLLPLLIDPAALGSKTANKTVPFSELRSNVTEAIQADRELFVRVNAVDALVLQFEGMKAVLGLIPFECADAALVSGVISAYEADFIEAITGNEQAAEGLRVNTAEALSVSATMCAAELAGISTAAGTPMSLILEVLATVRDTLTLGTWIVDDYVIGVHDTATSYAYDEIEGLTATDDEMVFVPAGSFEMGDPWGEGDGDEVPVHTVTLSAYEIGKYEVTNGEYADILNWALAQGYLTTVSSSTATAYGHELLDMDDSDCQISYSGGEFVVESRDGYSMADHPVVEVSWYGAAVYCNWLSEANGYNPCYSTTTWECDLSKNGYHLPTEAQWECAAAWTGSIHLRYGNGSDSISSSNVNYDDNNPLGLSGSPYTSPVGYYAGASSPIGCYDMSGNVWEWCNDWYDSGYYSISPETDPTGPSSGSDRVRRGGCWDLTASFCRTAYRRYAYPTNAYGGLGFRLSR